MDRKPLWMRGDSNRGVALWDMDDAYVLAVHIDGNETPLRLDLDDLMALQDALTDAGVPSARTPPPAPAPVATGKRGPPCDRCKGPTDETRDGYACTQCGNVIMWV